MNGIAIVTAGAAPAVGARRGHTRGRAKPARASGTPSDVSPARTATRHRVASGTNRFFGETRALRTARMGPMNTSRASRDVKVRHRVIPVPNEPTPHRRFQKTFFRFSKPAGSRATSLFERVAPSTTAATDQRAFPLSLHAPTQTRAMGGKVDTSKDQWWQKHNASNMVEVHSMDEFLGELKRCGEDKLVIVDFYARWCAACRALHPKLCKIAEANSADVVVIKIEFDDNKDLCRGMGVKVLPYFQLYKGSLGKVAGFSASISKVGRIREAIEEHRPGGAYDRDEDVGMGWPVDVDASKSGSEDEEPAGDREPAPAR